MSCQPNNAEGVRAFGMAVIAVSKQLGASGEKDRLKDMLHEEMRNSGIREQLETEVRNLVRQSGGADNVDLTELKSSLRFATAFSTDQKKEIQTIENSLTEKIKEFTRTRANNPQYTYLLN